MLIYANGVIVVAQFSWECSKCSWVNAVGYRPHVGKPLPMCQGCGHEGDVCDEVVFEPHPERKSKPASHAH